MTESEGTTTRREPLLSFLGRSLSCLLTVALLSSVARGQSADEELRARVIQSIERAQRALLNMQNRDGSWPNNHYTSNAIGQTSLVTLALLNSGVPPEDEAMRRAINWIKSPENDPRQTYDISLAIMALVASGDPTVKGKISRLTDRLVEYQRRGADGGNWGYQGDDGRWDNSNTQFAILGLREAYYAGTPVSREVWQRSRDHFLRVQAGSVEAANGAGWGYITGDPTGSMTVAGIASLTIINSILQEDLDVSPDGVMDCCSDKPDPVQQSIEAGIRWLSRHFRIRSNPGTELWPLYYLYGLERAGRFTGQRFFGEHDWYREGAEFLTSSQSVREGVWITRQEDAIVGTSLALLFLSKGLSPVVINKLKVGPRNPQTGDVAGHDWNRHPRDIANLLEYTSSLPKWPSLLTWQVVDLKTAADGEGVAALLQSPIQFLSGTENLDAIQGRELELLREYFAQGGFIFAVQNCENTDFDRQVRDLVRRIFDGQQELEKLLPTHDVYRSEFLFPPDAQVPELWGVDFGCRTAMIYAPYDHACRWDRWAKFDPPNRMISVKSQIDKSMKLGVNVIAYATGRELQDKLQRPKLVPVDPDVALNRNAVQIARLRHTGGWDTAPNALRRLQSALKAVNIDLAPRFPTMSPGDPTIFEYPLLYIHGRKNFQLPPEEIAALKTYLENGGFLFADACCGSEQFDRSFRKIVQEMFGRPLERIPPDNEIYQLKLGYDIRQVRRRIPVDRPGLTSLAVEESTGAPILEGIQIDGKYVIVYSKYDLSCALERQSTSACAGYPTEDAVRIAVNIVLYGLVQ